MQVRDRQAQTNHGVPMVAAGAVDRLGHAEPLPHATGFRDNGFQRLMAHPGNHRLNDHSDGTAFAAPSTWLHAATRGRGGGRGAHVQPGLEHAAGGLKARLRDVLRTVEEIQRNSVPAVGESYKVFLIASQDPRPANTLTMRGRSKRCW